MSALLSPLVFAIQRPLPVIAAAVLMLVIGFVWYGPLFGKTWKRLANVPDGGSMLRPTIINVVSCLIQAAVLGRLLTMTRVSSIVLPLSTTAMYWVAFTLTVLAVQYAYARRPGKLLAIDAVYSLLTWEAAAVLFTVWF